MYFQVGPIRVNLGICVNTIGERVSFLGWIRRVEKIAKEASYLASMQSLKMKPKMGKQSHEIERDGVLMIIPHLWIKLGQIYFGLFS